MMSWLLAIVLALLAFAAAAFLFRLPRRVWTTLSAALVLGLAGYALQASPQLGGAPAQPRQQDNELGWAIVEAREAMVAPGARSRNPKVLTADAFARNGQYANAAALLAGAVNDNPNDADAWLALGNALVEHADGALTAPALLAYRRAEEADPGSLGPGYFIGLAQIRQGRPDQTSQTWRQALASSAADAEGRAQLELLLGRLEEAMSQARTSQAPLPR